MSKGYTVYTLINQNRGYALSGITVSELDAMIENCFNLRQEYQEISRRKSEAHAELEIKQQEIIEALTELGKTSYKAPTGTFSYKIVENFRTPKDSESRAKFFSYLKEKGVYDEMVTVNSATLNSWAKEELATYDGLDMQIPGLVKCDPVFRASMRK